jgi:hypothetical protein
MSVWYLALFAIISSHSIMSAWVEFGRTNVKAAERRAQMCIVAAHLLQPLKRDRARAILDKERQKLLDRVRAILDKERQELLIRDSKSAIAIQMQQMI